MPSLILHHYPTSPFAEKIRRILGYKQLSWQSVTIPSVMPKPDVIALTGGYRRTPILQCGADIYCDTALIADVLEAQAPRPTLYPSGVGALSRTLAQWADMTFFWSMIPYAMQPAGLASLMQGHTAEQLEAFGRDRAAFRANLPRMRAPESHAALLVYLQRIDEMLSAAPFLCGSVASIADFSVYHVLWFLGRAGPLASILQPFARIQAWLKAMADFGHGTAEPLESDAALAIARASHVQAPAVLEVDTHGIGLGEPIVIASTDTGPDPIEGTLYAATSTRLSLLREDPRAGRVVVHFPRLGFEMRRPK